MNKVGLTLLTAVFGGAVALGGYKLFESKKFDGMSIEDKQKVYFANNPTGVISSTGNPDFTQAAAIVAPGVVHIKTTYTRQQAQGGGGSGSPFDMFEEFFGTPQGRGRQQRQAQPVQASGSGVIISEDGYIVTNNHVVEDADKIEVVLTDKRSFEAKVIGRDPNTDLALLKVTAKGLPVVKLGNSDNVNIGEWVLAVGYPLGLQSTVTAGIVSAKGRQIGILGENQQQPRGYGNQDQPPVNSSIESFIQTDAVINKGNSGGALVNADGELIGINSAIASPTGVYAGYGFAIPVNLVKKIVDDFIEFGNVKRGYIGITFTEITPELAKEKGISDVNGLYVQDIVKGGAAEAAGIQKSDLITKINGKLITSSPVLQETIGRLRPGDKVKLTFKRDGKEKEANVTLKGEEINKAADGGKTSKSATEIYNKLGASFLPASSEKKKELGINSGVVVTQINKGGVFEYFGVERGLVITEVNGVAVNSVDEIESALSKTKRNIVSLKGVPERGSTVIINVPIEY